jgi:predicted mannosyl-3-phosphoglycerate phosphatase (HAD superfamily)
MQKGAIHQCECLECQQPEPNPTRALHRHLNFFLSTLDEQQRRLYAGLEAQRLGRGGDQRIARITGLNRDTIARGRRELAQATAQERIRAPGGGRPRVEKKILRS